MSSTQKKRTAVDILNDDIKWFKSIAPDCKAKRRLLEVLYVERNTLEKDQKQLELFDPAEPWDEPLV